MSTISRIVFVCAGNICRSPMAAALFQHLAQGHPALAAIEVSSAGTIALNGNLPCAGSVEVMRKQFGIEIAPHRARPRSRRLDADLVLTMDRDTQRDAMALKLRARVEMLGDYVGTGEEVQDPYGRPSRRYREVGRQLERLIAQTVDKMAAELDDHRQPERR